MTDLDELEALIEAPFKQQQDQKEPEKEDEKSKKRSRSEDEQFEKYKKREYSKSPERRRSRENYNSRDRYSHSRRSDDRDYRRERDDRHRSSRRHSRERYDSRNKYSRRDDRREERRRSKSPKERGLNFKYEESSRRKRRDSEEFEYAPADHTLTDEQREKRTIFVYNLSVETNEKQIALFFNKVGRIRDVKLIKDRFTNRSKGFGFVEFTEASSVEEALRLTGKKLDDHTVMVKTSDADKNLTHGKDPNAVVLPQKTARRITQLFVSGIPSCITEEDLKNLFETLGKVVYVSIDKSEEETKTGWIKYKTPEDAKKGLIKINNLDLGGGFLINVSLAQLPNEFEDVEQKENIQKKANKLLEKMELENIQSKCVMLTNMFDPMTEENPNFELEIEEDVKEGCSDCGKIEHIYVDKKSKGNVYVKFDSIESAAKAKNELHGRYFDGKMIVVHYIVEKIYDSKFMK
eukprot:gene4806-8392_t